MGGAEWALDVTTGQLWQVPALGRGAWESVTEIDTGTTTHVAIILSEDSSPFDINGDADPTRALRSPDNLDWADDGFTDVQEDKAETDTLSGEFLFGPDAVNKKEAGIVRLDPRMAAVTRVATIDRSVRLDPTADATPFDNRPGAGEWETSGILDVSGLFGEEAGSLILFNVQAHGSEDQSTKSSANFGPNPNSRINDGDLVEGGQLTGDPTGDLGVEDLKFISVEESPNGAPLLLASNEVSGTVTIFPIERNTAQ